LDKVAVKEILRFEALWLDYMRTSRASTLSDISTKKTMTDDIRAALKSGMDEFLGMHEFEARAV